jgi:hypothetical protein
MVSDFDEEILERSALPAEQGMAREQRVKIVLQMVQYHVSDSRLRLQLTRDV